MGAGIMTETADLIAHARELRAESVRLREEHGRIREILRETIREMAGLVPEPPRFPVE